jgi:hypothetical protein
MSTLTDSPQSNRPTRSWRPSRFSLRGLILISALICAVVSHVRTSLELSQTKKEAEVLRNELGHLTITNANHVHAIAVGTDEAWAKKQWRWKLHLPEGRRFDICCKMSELSESDIPKGNVMLSGVTGDLTLSVSAIRNPKGEWQLVQQCDTGENLTSPISNSAWLEENQSATFDQTGKKSTKSVDPGEPLVLLRVRVAKKVPVAGGRMGVTMDPKPTDGIMVWVKEANRP